MSPTTQCPPAFERLQQPSEKPDWPGPRFLGRTVSDNVQLCQPEPGPKIRFDFEGSPRKVGHLPLDWGRPHISSDSALHRQTRTQRNGRRWTGIVEKSWAFSACREPRPSGGIPRRIENLKDPIR